MLGMRGEKEANQKREELEGDPGDGKGGWGGPGRTFGEPC